MSSNCLFYSTNTLKLKCVQLTDISCTKHDWNNDSVIKIVADERVNPQTVHTEVSLQVCAGSTAAYEEKKAQLPPVMSSSG